MYRESEIKLEFDLLSNGVDSFRNVEICLEKYEDADESFSVFHFKDAIIYLDHAVEILFKYILSDEQPYQIYKDPNKAKILIEKMIDRLEVKREKWREGKDAFITQKTPYNSIYDLEWREDEERLLYTIGSHCAVKKVTKLEGKSLREETVRSIEKVREIRNNVAHSSFKVNKEEVLVIIKHLMIDLETYFTENIPGFKEKLKWQRIIFTKKDREDHEKNRILYMQDEFE